MTVSEFLWSWERPEDGNERGYTMGVKVCGGVLYFVCAKEGVMDGDDPPCPGCHPDDPRWTKLEPDLVLMGKGMRA